MITSLYSGLLTLALSDNLLAYCGYRIVVIMSASQALEAGSTPATRSKIKSSLNGRILFWSEIPAMQQRPLSFFENATFLRLLWRQWLPKLRQKASSQAGLGLSEVL